MAAYNNNSNNNINIIYDERRRPAKPTATDSRRTLRTYIIYYNVLVIHKLPRIDPSSH